MLKPGWYNSKENNPKSANSRSWSSASEAAALTLVEPDWGLFEYDRGLFEYDRGVFKYDRSLFEHDRGLLEPDWGSLEYAVVA